MCLSALCCHNILQKKDKTKEMKAITDVRKVNKKAENKNDVKMIIQGTNQILRIVIAYSLLTLFVHN